MSYCRARFSHLSCRGASRASVYKLTTGEVLNAPKTFMVDWVELFKVLFTNPSARAGYDTRSIF